jgi:hypothetical protein
MMNLRKSISALLIAFVVALQFTPISVATAAEYKVGDDCSGAPGVEYFTVEEYNERYFPKNSGLWCFDDVNGQSTYQNIPVELDDAQVKRLAYRIEQIVCVNAKTRAECEVFGRKETKKILVNELGLTATEAKDILSCYALEDFAEEPPNTTCDTSYIEGPWEEGAPRVYYWHHYPERSAFTKFNDLDGGAKSSIIFFVLATIFFFALFYSGFRPNKSERNAQSTSVALVKTLLSIVGVALLIIFIVWLYIAFIEPFFNGNPIDFSKKVLGVPQYMWTVIYGVYYIAWNSNRKK